jgi:hypothetical protein
MTDFSAVKARLHRPRFARIARIRESVCRNLIVDFKIARAVMRRDNLEACS